MVMLTKEQIVWLKKHMMNLVLVHGWWFYDVLCNNIHVSQRLMMINAGNNV